MSLTFFNILISKKEYFCILYAYMNKINYNPSFGSLIHVSKIAYAREIVNKFDMPNIDYPWTIFQAKYLKNGYSEEASYCTMGVIKNEFGNGFMFHLQPGATPNNKIFENLKRACINLKYSNPLTGILIGGNATYKPSKELYNSLSSMFKELNVKYSALLGQNDLSLNHRVLPYSNLLFSGPQDKYIICPVANRYSFYDFSKNSNIHEFFDTVNIRKGDTLKLG